MQESIDLRLPPQDLDAERYCLGACLFGDGQGLEIVCDTLAPQDFYLDSHQRIFEAIQALRPRPADIDAVAHALKQAGRLDEAGGADYLIELVSHAPTTAYAEQYAARVAHLGRCRRAQGVLRQAVENLYRAGVDDWERIRRQVAATMDDAGAQGYPDVRLLGDVAAERVAALRERKPGELLGGTWGLKTLDRVTPGLEAGALYIIAARPSMGKTGLALTVARQNARATDRPWLFVTLEMFLEALADRLVTAWAMIDGTELRQSRLTSGNWDMAEKAATGLKSVPLYASADCVTVQDIRKRAAWLARQRGALGGVAVDYLQLMSGAGRGQNRQEQVAEMSRQLKLLAKEMACPVIALSQLSRAVEQRDNKRPKLSDLRESGAIEQDAEVVLFLHRQDYYDAMDGQKEKREPGKIDPLALVEVIIGKNRNMESGGTVTIAFRKSWQLYSDIERRLD